MALILPEIAILVGCFLVVFIFILIFWGETHHEQTSVRAIRRPGEACTVFLLLCRIQNLFLILHPNFFIPPTSKSKIQNPQNPKSPKSKIPKIQNPQNPKSPKSKIPEIWGHIKICYITFQNPKSKIPKIGQKSLDFGFWIGGFWILDFGPKIQNPKSPKSKIPKIQSPKSPKSKIPKIQNPKSPRSKIQNPQNRTSKIFRQNPKFGALGASHKELLHNDPKSKIQNPKSPNCGFWGFWILEFGFGAFWILDCGNFGFRGFWSLDFGDFGFWGFWCFWGGPGDVPLGNLVTVLGGQRLESPLVRLSGTVQNQLYLI